MIIFDSWSSLLHVGFLELQWAGATVRCHVQASRCSGFRCFKAWALGSGASLSCVQTLVAPWCVESSWTKYRALNWQVDSYLMYQGSPQYSSYLSLITSFLRYSFLWYYKKISQIFFLLLWPLLLGIFCILMSSWTWNIRHLIKTPQKWGQAHRKSEWKLMEISDTQDH